MNCDLDNELYCQQSEDIIPRQKHSYCSSLRGTVEKIKVAEGNESDATISSAAVANNDDDERGNNGATDKLLFGLKECLKHSRGDLLSSPLLCSAGDGQTD